MILKASQRGGAAQLGQHLLKTEENEHVEIHEISGFIADDLMGAMKEAQALALGTRCRQHLFSVSLSPPSSESVRVEVFEQACDRIQERLGLTGQPRMIVFHEKEGRRHAHLVVSRIDAATMTAKPLSFFKKNLSALAKELYLENGWQMPEGFRDGRLRDPRNFTLAEWQQAKRAGLDAREVKGTVQDCWKASDNGAAFATALEARGLFLARGDRRGHVAVTINGEAFAIARMVGVKTKEVTARLGDPASLRNVADTKQHIGQTVAPRLSRFISEAKRIAHNAMKPLAEEKQTMKTRHADARAALDARHRDRQEVEQRARSARVRTGVKGAWDILTGRYFRTRRQNEMEAHFGRERDRGERHELVRGQLQDRQSLQGRIVDARRDHAERLLGLYRDAANYRQMGRAERGDAGRGTQSRGAGRTMRPHGPELRR
jgi:hypothetical protein